MDTQTTAGKAGGFDERRQNRAVRWERPDLMLSPIVRPTTGSQDSDASGPEAELPPRALHARLLENAALRRKRGLERRRNNRMEDADYWLHAAPAAIRKASALREEKSFAPLP